MLSTVLSGAAHENEAALILRGSGFASIHPSDGFDILVSPVLSGAAHEAAAGHASQDQLQSLLAKKRETLKSWTLRSLS